ncbi:Uma2 family endonuclease [Sphingomonas sp.]|uniref:Uma2 family endonuclease n=1 Tax=Sphingomonas sp. TaxID=28214 RepID=UPI00333FF61E
MTLQERIGHRDRIKLRVEDYATLDQSGAFAPYIATELIDGMVYAMSPQYRPHGFVKDELAYRLRRALEANDSSLHVATEQSIEIAPYNEPQPDIIVTSQPRGTGAIPASSITLLVEVSVTTLEFDTVDKAALYAATAIPEYWVVDVDGRVVHQMWGPVGERYAEQRTVGFGERIAAETIVGLAIDTESL